MERRQHALDVGPGADHDQADSHVEGAEHLLAIDPAAVFDQPEEGRHVPRPEVDRCRAPIGQRPWEVLCHSAARDVGHALHQIRGEQGAERAEVRAVRRQQRIRDRDAELWHPRVGHKPAFVEQHPARQRVSVGMESRGREGHQRITRRDPAPVDDAGPVHCAHDEPGDVVLAVRIKPRHLGGFAPKEGTAVLAAPARHTGHHLLRDIW